MKTIFERIKKSGKSLEKISDESQIPVERLRAVGEGEPASLAELRKLAATLGLELSDFLDTDQSKGKTALLFRQTMGNKIKQSHLPAVEYLSNQMEQSIELLPNYQPPDWLKNFDEVEHNYINAQRLAEKFRSLFFGGDQVSPICELPGIAVEQLDILLMVAPKLKIDGASAIINGVSFIFVSPRFPPRMLFTLAHELGHMISHHRFGESYAIFDTEQSIGTFGARKGVQEGFVDAFASCLLLPAAGVGIALKKIRELHRLSGDRISDLELLYLSHIFGVSFLVAAKRCEDIGLIEKGSAFSLYEKLQKEHKSPEKRALQLKLPPRPEIKFPTVPSRLLQSAAEKIKRGEVSIGKAANTLKLSVPTLIEKLSSV